MNDKEKDLDDGVEVEIEIEEEESSEAPAAAKADSESDSEAEKARKAKRSDDQDFDLEEQSEKVKKRIDKLTFKIREAERREQAALDYARGVKTELDTIKEKASVLDKTLVQEFDTRIKSQEKMAKDRLKQAIDMGDADAQIEAQTALANLAVENERLRISKLRREQEEAQERQRFEQEEASRQQASRQPRPDPKAQRWAENNEWFGTDRAMTATAYAIHEDLVTREGYDPTTDEYYEELDHRMRQDFPHKFQRPTEQRQQSPVASARAVSKPSQTKFKLTPSQIRIAKALNVSLEEYAKHARKQMQGQ